MSIRFLKKPLLVLFILSIIITLVLGFSNRIVPMFETQIKME